MATVARTNNSARQGAAQALSTTAQGMVEGAKLAEDKRRDQRNFEEQQRQFDRQMQYRMDQLRVMQEQGHLTRKQQERLAAMQEQGATGRMREGFTQQTNLQDDQQAHLAEMQGERIASTEKMHQQSIDQSEKESRRQAWVTTQGQDKSLQVGMAGIRAANTRAMVDEGVRIGVWRGVLAGRDYNMMNEEQKRQVLTQAAQEIYGPDSFDQTKHGAYSDEEQQRIYASLANEASNMKQVIQDYEYRFAQRAELLGRGSRGVDSSGRRRRADEPESDSYGIPAEQLFQTPDPDSPTDVISGMGRANAATLGENGLNKLNIVMADQEIERYIMETHAYGLRGDANISSLAGRGVDFEKIVDARLRHSFEEPATKQKLRDHWMRKHQMVQQQAIANLGQSQQ